MAFDLTDEQRELIERTRAVARDRLVPIVTGGAPGRVNRALVKALGDEGLLPRLFPRRAGGSQTHDVSAFELCLLREALAYESPEADTALAMQGLGGYPILQSGSPEQVERWLPPIARGEAIGAFALTEPNAGSDAGALELRADPDGAGGWRMTGEKTWISNAPDADVYVLFARTTPEAGAKGVTAFVVPGDAEGLSGEPIALLGDHPIGRLQLESVAAGPAEVLGEPDHGFRVAMRTLDLFRPSVGAFAVGMAQRALDEALAHAAGRSQFGTPLTGFQAVSHSLAEMATRIDAARLLVHRAAAAYDEARPGVTKTSAMAKLFATETAQWVVDKAVQIHGASGLEKGHPLEHLYRAVRSPRIYEGASEIQREIIARELYRER